MLVATENIHVIVLNYNGRHLLEECLPTLVRAADHSRHHVKVIVLDNCSTDGSVRFVKEAFPRVWTWTSPNLGLCSYNAALAKLTGRIAILVNNDVKLADNAIDLLVTPLLEPADPACFLAAPRCFRFDESSHEGERTAVGWRWGLVRATAFFPGFEHGVARPGVTASAGAVMAVDRRIFLSLGGFDPIFLPGRLEDLDFAYRGFLAGYVARYVPEAIALHRGQETFDAVYGAAGSDALALRNTLLFQWKNLRHPRHVARHVGSLPLRLAYDAARSLARPRSTWFPFARALAAAVRRWRQMRPAQHAMCREREREFFQRFSFAAMARGDGHADWKAAR